MESGDGREEGGGRWNSTRPDPTRSSGPWMGSVDEGQVSGVGRVRVEAMGNPGGGARWWAQVKEG